MPALIDYLNENPTYLKDCRTSIANFDAILQESAYRAYRRRVNARSRPVSTTVKELNVHPVINVGHILHSKRKRKKTVNYAVVQSQRFHEEQRQRERERMARRKLERERMEKERIAERQARERERLERRRLKELERIQKFELRRGFSSRTVFDADYPKSYGLIKSTNKALESKSEPESLNSIILSIAHFAWSAAPVLRLDETTIRVSSFEKILNTNNNNNMKNNEQPNPSTEFADIFLTRLVCKPHTLPRFRSPILFHMGLDRTFWQPRVVKTIKIWFRKHRIVQELLSAHDVLTSYVPPHRDIARTQQRRLTHAEL